MNDKKCSADNCDNTRRGRSDYCDKHYQQLKRYGKVLKVSHKDRNEIFTIGDQSEIVLYNMGNEEIARAIIDTGDIGLISMHKWSIKDKKGYVANGGSLYLHRLIVGEPKGMLVDHINHNPLDNRKCNLRICTRAENNRNITLRVTSISGVRGVTWDSRYGKWEARIMVDGIQMRLGKFVNKEDAISVRIDAELKYFKEFANPTIRRA